MVLGEVVLGRRAFAGARDAWSSLRHEPWLAVAVVASCLALFDAVVRLSTRNLVTVVPAFLALGLVALHRAGVRPSALRTPLDLAVGAGLAAGGVAFVVNGLHGGRRLVECAVLVAAFYLFVGVQRAWAHGRTALALTGALAVGIAAATAVAQWVTGADTGYCRAEIVGGADSCQRGDAAVRAVGTLSNPNLLAPVLVLLVPVGCVALRAVLGRRRGRVAAASLGVLGAAAVATTLSRGGLVSLGALGVAALALRYPSRRTLVGAGLAVGAGVVVAFGALLARFSIGPRADVYRESLGLVREHVWGVGLGRSGPFIDARVPGDQRFYHSHNLWLTWLVEAGTAGLAATLWLTLAVVLVVVRGARRGDALVVAAGCGLAGFAVISLFDNPAFRQSVAVPLWAVVAIAVAREAVPRRGEDEPGAAGQFESRARDAGRGRG
ncbi:O-antigen ligase family protein [Nocardioides sp. ChNu-153]|uniref:O-antigen ligase family protein n=1 Tax=unclassified Nocardioides TaxID=2615069 RepID=UPI0024049661|nr:MULTISPECIES: O-antigen ligase family protein [unclassified Nocardioides]MDF9717786.1 O-antigen ligase family protein [Nocardioides sp. ChNu-99]MDN7123147.1 O-antigen ligase family protein [Nocardioides sp. ChNu-153]